MCTVNMTFEVPESKHIDIEALKRQVHAFISVIIDTPSVLKKDKAKISTEDMSFFDRFDNDWSDDPRDSHEIAAELHDARVNTRTEMEPW